MSDLPQPARPWPSLSEAKREGGSVEIAEPVDFDAPDEDTVRSVVFLREAAAHGVPVRWTGRCSDPAVRRVLTHLPPSAAPLCAADESGWLAWRSSYRLGLLYSRSGPGFRIIQDRRPHRSKPARIVVGDARLLAALDTCGRGARFAAAGIEKAARHLAAADLVLILGHDAVTLPYRLPAWPVPAYSV